MEEIFVVLHRYWLASLMLAAVPAVSVADQVSEPAGEQRPVRDAENMPEPDLSVASPPSRAPGSPGAEPMSIPDVRDPPTTCAEPQL